eukprot:2314664-Pleurochrysis_carterae.AAC.1
MAQPPFEAWMKRSKGRVQLVISFKLLVLTDTGSLNVPPNCVYSDADLQTSKALAVQVLEEMAAEGMELSSKFWALLGKQQQSQQMAE